MICHYPGRLIVIEGIDGTGKSTQAALLEQWLQDSGFETIRSFEPTQGQYGSLLRRSMTEGRFPQSKEIDLFLKDRKEHVEELIIPALREGKVVILDRYYFSMMAYQGARGADPLLIRNQNEIFAPQPDLMIYLQLSVQSALNRIGIRNGSANEFEQKGNLEACSQIFDSLIDEAFVSVVSAEPSMEEVHHEIRSRVSPLLRSLD